MPWQDWTNAAIYQAFVREHTLYRDLNRELVRRAGLGDARRVLDLACGTGATARAALAAMPADAELVGVDASGPMVEIARAEVADARARFRVGGAASVAEVISGPFDRALCNAAFWQFPSPGAALASLARVLAPGATFVWNVPAERVAGEEEAVHPLQVALARAVAERTPEPAALPAAWLAEGQLPRLLADHGFTLLDRELWHDRRTQGELLELMAIPAMIGRAAPSLDLEQRRQVLEQVAGRIDSEAVLEVGWVFYRVAVGAVVGA